MVGMNSSGDGEKRVSGDDGRYAGNGDYTYEYGSPFNSGGSGAGGIDGDGARSDGIWNSAGGNVANGAGNNHGNGDSASDDAMVRSAAVRVFVKMGAAMIVCAFAAWLMMVNRIVLGVAPALIGLALIIILNIALARKVGTASPASMYAMLVFEALYIGALTGGTLQYYDRGMIIVAFIVTALLFVALAIVGLTTRRDLTRMGNVALVALIVLIIVELALLLVNAPVLWMIASAVSIIVFTVLTARDAQRITEVVYDGSRSAENLTTMIALSMFLDFVNLFMSILRIIGSASSSR